MDSVVKEICGKIRKHPSNAARSVPTPFRHHPALKQLSTINYQLSIKKNGKEFNLGKDSPHRHHRAYRHCHHLRSDLVHGRVKPEKGAAMPLSLYHSKSLPLLLQLLHGRFERFRRLDDVVIAPEILVPIFLHHIVEDVTLTEGVAHADAVRRAVGAVHHHHLGRGGERRGEQALLPVALETHQVAQIVDISPAVLITVSHQIGHLAELEAQSVGLLAEDVAHGLVMIAEVEAELGTGDCERLLVDVEQARVERIVEDDARLEGHHILHAVIDAHGELHLEAIAMEHILGQEVIAVLGHIEIDGQIGPSGYLHGQRVTLLLTLQTTALENLHAVGRHVAQAIIGLVDIGHGL